MLNCLPRLRVGVHRRRIATSLYAGLLILLLGVIAWVSGQPFIFPSLGPSAFILAFEREQQRRRSVRIVLSHALGAVAGVLAYTLLAGDITITASIAPFSAAGFRLAASATLSIAATSWAMIATDAVHPPACATTLIVSLGLLSTPLQVVIIVLSVLVLVAFHAAVVVGYRRLVGEALPLHARQ